MRTVELFAGIGGFRIAADRLGHRTLWANDLCPLATRVYRERFGAKGFHEGDIRERIDDIPPHDLLTAGFPCQPFSAAGKKQGIEDPRGTLFSVIVDVLRRRQPRYFVLENVKRLLAMDRGMHFATILASLAEFDYRIEWRLLNAMHFALPQNRQRVFLIGVHRRAMKRDGNAIRLASPDDLQESSFEQTALARPAAWREITDHASRFPNWGVAESGRFYAVELERFAERSRPVLLRSVLEPEVARAFDFTHSTRERIRASRPVRRFVDGVEILSNQRGGARMGYTVFGVNGVSPTLTSTTSRHYERYRIGRRYRRLTNVEYARIQGFADDHCAAAPLYDQYALLGNAVPPPMAGWVIKRLGAEENHATGA
jgi:DNA (cytosine-5)-methyltransferase 1